MMSSRRTLSTRFAWTDESQAFELLDWETRPDHFDQLCEHTLQLLVLRCRITRERVFETLPEAQFRQEVRAAAEMFEERFFSLPMFVYMRLKFVVLPERERLIRQSQP